MPRPQLTLRALLVAMLAVACFFGGIRFERERQRQGKQKIEVEFIDVPVLKPMIVTDGPDGKEVIIAE